MVQTCFGDFFEVTLQPGTLRFVPISNIDFTLIDFFFAQVKLIRGQFSGRREQFLKVSFCESDATTLTPS